MLRCYRVVFPVFCAVLELLPRYCHNVVELFSLCYRFVVALLSSFCAAVVALFLPCCCVAATLLSLCYCAVLHCCCAVVALQLRFALLFRCCPAVLALLSRFGSFPPPPPFNSCSSFSSSFLRCQSIVTSAVFSFYNVFQLELKFCKGLSAFLFFYPSYYVMLFIGQIFCNTSSFNI